MALGHFSALKSRTAVLWMVVGSIWKYSPTPHLAITLKHSLGQEYSMAMSLARKWSTTVHCVEQFEHNSSSYPRQHH
jgi:hypothetical protein